MVESGPGGPLAQQFDFEVWIYDVANLWSWNLDAVEPTDGPDGPKPQITAAAKGSWWQYHFDYVDAGSFYYLYCLSGEPTEHQSGQGALASLTVDYEGVQPGTYALTFETVELGQWVIDDPDDPTQGHMEPITDFTVQPLTITVEPGVAPTPDPMTWEVAPHPASSSQIDMTASAASDDHSPPESIQYRFEIDGTPAPWQSSRQYADAGLGPNTPRSYRVQARDGAGNETAWSSVEVVHTLAGPPEPGSFEPLGPNSVQATWTAGGNPPGTHYVAECWTPALGGTLVQTSAPTTALSWTFDALSPNTPYACQVKAINGDGVPTTYADLGTATTHAEAPGAGALDVLGSSSIRASWGTGANPPATEYQVKYAKSGGADQFSPWLTGSTWDATGLDPNATYAFEVRARNGEGVETAYTDLGSATTHAEAPGAGALDVLGSSNIRASWGTGANPPATEYQVKYAKSGGADQFSPWLTGSTWDATGLDPNATYAFEVRARNGEGVETAYTDLGSATTHAEAPGAGALDVLGSSNIRASWGTGANPPATEYQVKYTKSGGPDQFSPWLTGSTWDATGLDPNATYAFEVRARNGEGVETAYTDLGSATTHAEAPGAGALDVLGSSSIRATWGTGANPPATEYQVKYTKSGGPDQFSPWLTGSTWDATGLDPNATYAFEVRARNGEGVETAYTDLGSATTHAEAPGAGALDVLGSSSIRATWGTGANPPATEYQVKYTKSGGGDQFSPWITGGTW
ncbi:MAG: fibronectin type III domain-containing protein, partial [bacterium]